MNAVQNKKFILLDYNQPLPNLETAIDINNHFHNHHMVYQRKYNTLVQEHPEFAELIPIQVLLAIWEEKQSGKLTPAKLKIFRNGLQALNHEKFWESLKKLSAPIPNFPILAEDFIDAGMNHFASGWLWIVKINNTVDICTTHNEESIEFHTGDLYTYQNKFKVTSDTKELAVYDLWEHAYYLDYMSNRSEYLKQLFSEMINWDLIRQKTQDIPWNIFANPKNNF